MPRFRFTIFDGVTTTNGDVVHMETLVAARLEAMRLASELLDDEVKRENLGHEWRIGVADEKGLTLFELDIVMTIKASAD
jgi:hypothetical protein